MRTGYYMLYHLNSLTLSPTISDNCIHAKRRSRIYKVAVVREAKMQSIEELKKQFIVGENLLKSRLEPLVGKALAHCRIDKDGRVEVRNTKLSGREQVKLTLAARAIGSEMDSAISPEVSVLEISKFTGLPANQV